MAITPRVFFPSHFWTDPYVYIAGCHLAVPPASPHLRASLNSAAPASAEKDGAL